MLQSFETSGSMSWETNDPKKHHKNNPTFQKDFCNDPSVLFSSFTENPFLMNKLMVIDSIDTIFEENIYRN